MSIDVSKIRAIDPPGCSCQKCVTGEHVPYDSAVILEVLEATLNGSIAPVNNINRDRLTQGTIILYRGDNNGLFVTHDFTLVSRSDVIVILPNSISPIVNPDIRDVRNADDEYKQECRIIDAVNGAATANTTNSTFIAYVSPKGKAGFIELPRTSTQATVAILPYGS